jgi:hypothetical protein
MKYIFFLKNGTKGRGALVNVGNDEFKKCHHKGDGVVGKTKAWLTQYARLSF